VRPVGESREATVDNFDALAYALWDRDFDAVRRLLALGARPGNSRRRGAVPVALVPVVSGDVAGVRVMRKLESGQTAL
jgi:hypothetical protein